MRKTIYILLILLFCSVRASAQFTLVSGTVKDTNGLPYSCGTITASIINNNGQSLYLNGVQFSPAPSATKLGCPTDPSTSTTPGAFTVQLADNTQLKCGSGASIVTCGIQTQWFFTVNTTGIPPPQGTGPQVCTGQSTVSGATQTVNLSVCPALSNVSNAGSAVGQISVKSYGAVGDTKASRNCTTAPASKIVANTDNPWISADVGKFMEIVQPNQGTDVFTPARKIASFQSAGQVTMDTLQDGPATPGGGNFCKWFTQDDTNAFVQAKNAARAATSAFRPRDQTPTLGYQGEVLCPPGGYTVSGTIFFDASATPSLGIALFGAHGGSHCVVYPTATFVGTVDPFCSGVAEGLIYSCNTDRTDIENIYMEGHNVGIPLASIGSGQGWIMTRNCGNCTVKNNTVTDISFTGNNTAALYAFSTSGVIENNFIQNGGGTTGETACAIGNSTGLLFSTNNCSNHNQSLIITNSGTRGSSSGQLIMLNNLTDECIGGPGTVPCTQIVNSVVNYIGGGSFGGVPEIMSIDGTSQVYMTDHNLQQFGASVGNIPGVAIAAGGLLQASQSTFASNGAATIFSGPATASYVDVGGNTYFNCLSGACTKITGTDFTTHGFSGGISPTTSLTHTYPQPFLPALPASGTALNIVAFTPTNSVMVKNFTITAGNTPTCATPPTFQISNGTQSFTQTFANSAQISGPFTPALTLFPSGTQVTLSITNAAYACATAPTNMNWSIEWQSAVSF